MPTVAGVRAQLSLQTTVRALAWLAPLLTAIALAFQSGGYFLSDWGIASIVMMGCLAIAALVVDIPAIGVGGAVALAGLAGFGVWQGLSSAWAYEPAAAIEAMNLTLLYAAAFALVLLGVRRRDDLAALLVAALAGAAAITAYAVGSRLLPGLIGGDDQPRLANPISYWNGLGTITAFGVVLAVGLGGALSMPRAVRAASASLVPLFLVALLLTYSRGAVLVLALVLLLLLAVAPGRLETALIALTTGLASLPLLVMTNDEDSLAALNGVLPPHEDAGRRILLILLATMAACAVIGWLAAALLARASDRGRRLGGAVAAAIAVCILAGVLVARAPDQGYVQWSQDQWESFKRFDASARADAASVSDRLAVAAGTGRWQNWGVAADEFVGNPVTGSGAGDYVFYWEHDRDIDLKVVNAHSLYMEVLGETGGVGLLLLAVPAAVALTLLARRRDARAREVIVALCGAAVVALHAAGDWDWQLPAVVLPGVALAAGAIAVMDAHGERTDQERSGASRWILAGAAVAAILVVTCPMMSARATDEARAAASRGDLAAALSRADEAVSLAPQNPAPRLVRANVLSDLGRSAAANSAFAAAAARSPRDWIIFADWADALMRRGDREDAVVAAERAQDLNPLEPRVRYLMESLGR